jgi:hypothetical protein
MFRGRFVATLIALGLVATACSVSVGNDSNDDSAPSKTYEANGVTFDYPSEWRELKAQSGAQTSGSSQLWTATVGPEQSDLVNLSAYQLSLEVNEGNIDDVQTEVDQVIQGLVAQANGTIESGPEQTTIAGFPAYKYEWSGVEVNDEEKSSEVYLVFNGKTEYFFNCQYSASKEQDVLAGCHTILDSFDA